MPHKHDQNVYKKKRCLMVVLQCLQIGLIRYTSEKRLKHDKLNNFCEYEKFFVRLHATNRLVAYINR